MDEAGQLALQSDVDVDWPERPCAEADSGPDCTITSTHGLVFPAGFPPGTYAIVAGLYDPTNGQRAPVTSHTGVTPPQIELGQVHVLGKVATPTAVDQKDGPRTSATPTALTENVRAEPGGEFAVFLTPEDLSPQSLLDADLSSLELEEQAILSSADILRYATENHEIELIQPAVERINQLQVPTAGRAFVVTVGDEPIYGGAFWTPASSVPFGGVVIEVPLIGDTMRIQLGYPEPLGFFTGQDPRSDSRVLESLDRAGKLE
jgi:hypothetical protein